MSRLYQIFYHPITEIALGAILVAGLFALVLLMLGVLQGGRRRVAQALAGLMLLTIPASMLIEEVIPMIGRDPPRRVAEVGLGMAGFLAALVALIAGAARFIRLTLTMMALREGRVGARAWVRIWAPSLWMFALSVVLFVLSAALYHENRFPLGSLLG